MSESLSATESLQQGLHALGVTTAPEPLMHYLDLLVKWNKAYNLTAIRDIDAMVTRHLLDSLAISPWINKPRLLDVGSGAGLPGLPLAIAHKNLQVVLLDSNGKKIRFLQEVKRALQLNNLEVIHARVENYRPDVGFDTITTRAFSELTQMISWTQHLIDSSGKWLAMKGRYPETELMAINRPYQVMNYTVPGLVGERCCVIIENLV